MPVFTNSIDARQIVEQHIDLAGQQIGIDAGRAAIGHMHDVELGHELEQLARHVHRGAVAGRREGELAGIGLGVGDELGNGLHRQRRRHHHDVGELA